MQIPDQGLQLSIRAGIDHAPGGELRSPADSMTDANQAHAPDHPKHKAVTRCISRGPTHSSPDSGADVVHEGRWNGSQRSGLDGNAQHHV